MRFLSLLASLFLAGCGCCSGTGEIFGAFARDAEMAEYEAGKAARRDAASKLLPDFRLAWSEQNFARVADLADQVDCAFSTDAERAWFHVRAATACERIGKIDRAIDYWNDASFESSDPDAKQAWTRLMAEHGRFTNGAPTKADLEAKVLALGDSGNEAALASAWLVLGDRWNEEGGHQQAALCYRFGTEKALLGDRPAVATSGLLRQARALLAAGHFEVVARKLQQIEGRAVPLALEFEAQLAAAKEAVAADRAARVAKELGDFTFPADVVFPGVLASAKGVTIERDGAMATIRCADGAAVTVRVDGTRPEPTFDPWRRCMVLHDVAIAPDVALLFANGDLFIGADSLVGRGLYLSAERPATVGPCRFGIPLERATVTIQETVHAQLDDGEVRVAAKYVDGSAYIGTAVRDGERLLPHGYGLLFRPERGYFVGQFLGGRPEEGAYLTSDGHTEVYSAGERVETFDATGSFANERSEVRCEAGDCIEYFDRRNGVTVEYDRVSLLKTKTDLERLAQNSERAEAARRFQEERLASEARQREADAEPVEVESSDDYPAFDGWCLRCDGTGSLYVAGSASQEMIWSATGGSDSRGGWVMGTVHRSGTIETCHWCNGTGLR